jgi:hypothetical protein
MNIGISNICTWNKAGVGTKVLYTYDVLENIGDKLENKEVKFDEFGHACIIAPELSFAVSCGVGPQSDKVEDYVLRSYRGVVAPYLKRHLAAKADSVKVILYTRNAYLSDPDVKGDADELARIEANPDYEYIVVCVLASAGPKAPVAAGRFVANLAGGNPEWTKYDRDTLVEMAIETNGYHSKWSTVAD